VLAEAEPGQQALLVLAYLRKGETFAELARSPGERANAQLKTVHCHLVGQTRGV
jgi:hypothetical protein